MYNKEVNLCPFCGGKADVQIGTDNITVTCKTCGNAVSGFTYNPEDRQTMYDAIKMAVKEWNQIKA